MSLIEIYILGVFLLDMFLTGLYLNEYKKRFPKNDWTLSEANPILRAYIREWGLVNGMVYGSLAILIILCMIVVLVNVNMRFFIGGFYSMAVIYHFVNFQALKQLKGGKWKIGIWKKEKEKS